ncbi:zinc transporter ZIP1-like [Periophthalmus magnuspinnatus]|nr:zinc transporter ZIP1-like [Periophthalmus magnuspinnatus]
MASPMRSRSLGVAPALEVKLGALALLFSLTLIFGISPMCLVRCTHNPDLRRRVLSLTSCFAGGVFFATCLLDLLPDYLQGINQAFNNAGITLQFPLPEFIMAMGFFLVLVLEQILLSFKPSSFSNPSSSVHDESRHLLDSNHIQTSDAAPQHRSSQLDDSHHHHLHVDFSSQSALRAFILVFSLSLHSVFEGLAVGLVEEEKEVLELCLALVIHKSIIAISLCFRLIQGRIRRSVAAGCLMVFASMTPLGIAIGVGLTEETKSSPKQQIVRSSLEGLAAGTFIYITFMEILPHELQGPPRSNMPKVCMLLLGFALVTAVLFIKL